MKVLYIDNDPAAIQTFKLTVSKLTGIQSVTMFTSAQKALEFVLANPIDIAFLDIEVPVLNGLEIANKLKKIDINIKIIYITAHKEYAFEAWQTDAIGYLLKPYKPNQIQHEIEKAKQIRCLPKKNIFIQTIPHFEVYIDGVLFPIKSAKPKELLALLVDRNGSCITAGTAISCLWENRSEDESVKSLYRMTYKRLKEILKEGGIDYILGSNGSQRFIHTDLFSSDYFQIIKGDKTTIAAFNGEYMSEYSWAEITNGRLCRYLGC